MKKFIVMTVITACLALCAAVWPQTEVVNKVPTPAQPPPCAPQSRPLRNSKQKLKLHHRQRKERLRFRNRNYLKKSSKSRSPCSRNPPQLPNLFWSQCLNRYLRRKSPPPRKPRPNPHRQSSTRSPATWSMCPVSAGWKAKALTMLITPRTCMRTATKSASWDKRIPGSNLASQTEKQTVSW